MRTGKIHLISKGKSALFIHPNNSILQAYLDNELKALHIPIVARHLENCSACKGQLNQLKITFQRFQEMEGSWDSGEKGVLAKSLERVRGVMQDWRKKNLPMGEFQWETIAHLKNMRLQLSEEIGIYLGSKMTQELSKNLGKTLEDNQKLILAAEPMLAAFFGNKAAARVHQFTFMLANQSVSVPSTINAGRGTA